MTYFCTHDEGDYCRYETCVTRYIGGTPLSQDCWGGPCLTPADGTIDWGNVKIAPARQ
jgi:hypothetical protein